MITLREKIGTFVEGPKVQGFVLALIIANAITLGLETVPSIADAYGVWLRTFDQFVIIVFVFEILGKLIYRN